MSMPNFLLPKLTYYQKYRYERFTAYRGEYRLTIASRKI